MNSRSANPPPIRALMVAGVLLAAALGFAGGAQAYTLKTLYSFCARTHCDDGAVPRNAALLIGPDGTLYGVTTQGGGRHDHGVVFALVPNADKSAWRYKRLHKFCARSHDTCPDGAFPFGGLILDAAGNLYGTTASGGPNGAGAAFELSPPQPGSRAWSETVLYGFCAQPSCADGAVPTGRLTYAGAATGALYDGVSPLYGTADEGGNNSFTGVAFALVKNGGSWSELVLYDFCRKANCKDGANPPGDLWLDESGTLFGTTIMGGTNNPFGGNARLGTLFKLVFDGTKWRQSVLYDFCAQTDCADGEEPRAGLVADGAGNFYGTTPQGGTGCSVINQDCGVAFRLGADGSYSVLYSFCSLADCADGAVPLGVPVRDAAGALYGTTADGGANAVDDIFGDGTVFKLSGGTLETLYNFCSAASCADGAAPEAGLAMDAAGNLFGTTVVGGASGKGTVFELTP